MAATLTLIGLATGIMPTQIAEPISTEVIVDLAWINTPELQQDWDRLTWFLGDEGPPLTERQLDVLWCESGRRFDITDRSGRHRGEAQWLVSTWRAAAVHAGEGEWAEVDPIEVPGNVQRRVFVGWWDRAGTEAGIRGQWECARWN